MTRNHLLQTWKLVLRDYQFRITSRGKIRGRFQSRTVCPLTAVYHAETGRVWRGVNSAHRCARHLDLDTLTTCQVLIAADERQETLTRRGLFEIRAIRAWMEAALTEAEKGEKR